MWKLIIDNSKTSTTEKILTCGIVMHFHPHNLSIFLLNEWMNESPLLGHRGGQPATNLPIAHFTPKNNCGSWVYRYVVVSWVTDAKLQCNICIEEFQLDEPVRTLPCKHFYHPVCISTWLQLVSAMPWHCCIVSGSGPCVWVGNLRISFNDYRA